MTGPRERGERSREKMVGERRGKGSKGKRRDDERDVEERRGKRSKGKRRDDEDDERDVEERRWNSRICGFIEGKERRRNA